MFNAILWTQWKATRGIALLSALVAFALPLASLQSAVGSYRAQDFVARMQNWGTAYALLAAFSGLLVALAAWRPDLAGNHVYALSLPIARPRYALFRLGAGAAFLLPAVAGVLFGAVLVSISGAIPDGLHAYPVALTLRFTFAAVVAYALFFAIASSTPKTAGVVLGVIAGLIFAQYLLTVFADNRTDLLGPLQDFIFYKPGILSVFAGRWMLVDV